MRTQTFKIRVLFHGSRCLFSSFFRDPYDRAVKCIIAIIIFLPFVFLITLLCVAGLYKGNSFSADYDFCKRTWVASRFDLTTVRGGVKWVTVCISMSYSCCTGERSINFFFFVLLSRRSRYSRLLLPRRELWFTMQVGSWNSCRFLG